MNACDPATGKLLERLGYAADARLIIWHADDLGMCRAENQATLDHLSRGMGNCGSIMAPCAWVPHILEASREHPELDLGVHLTLNAEWHNYRWAPLTGRDPASGLVDSSGYMWASVPELHRHMDIDAARAELRAQVEYLLGQGLALTHIDTHMGAVLHPDLAGTVADLALEFNLPVLLPRSLLMNLHRFSAANPALATAISHALQRLERANWPLVDVIQSCNAPAEERVAGYLEIIDSLPPGITHLLYHAAVPGDEIAAIDRANWTARVADYNAIGSDALKEALSQCPNVHAIGYRQLAGLIAGTHA